MKKRYEETIGIVGGMGSYATLDFFRRLLDAFPAEKEWDRPRILIDNRCTMPSRVRAILYQEERQKLVSELAMAAKDLIGCGADYLIFGCNTSHVFLNDVFLQVPEAKQKTIHLIEILARQMNAQNVCCAHLLATEGTIESGIYQSIFDRYGITLSVPEVSQYSQIRRYIELVKQHKVTSGSLQCFQAFCQSSTDQHVILGCTELPVLAAGYSGSLTLWDPLDAVIHEIKRIIH